MIHGIKTVAKSMFTAKCLEKEISKYIEKNVYI